MLRWIALIAVAASAALAVRWALRRVDEIGRPRAFPRYSVAGLAILGVLAAIPVVRHDRLEHRLSAVASQLAGRAVTVHCQTAGEEFIDAGAELGFVRYDASGRPEPHTLIKREPCGDLKHYLSNHGSSPSMAQVIAVHVLTHESMHMRGLTNEADAECAAMQRDASTATLLGASAADALALAHRYFDMVYPNMPDDYRSGDCAAGSRLDEKLPNSPW